MKRAKPLIVDLSIDFDFFVREKWIWDWGHGEDTTPGDDLHNNFLWQVRYQTNMVHMYTAMDPAKHADFQPTFMKLLGELALKKVMFVHGRTGEFGYADSHQHAFPFFQNTKGRTQAEREPPDMLINLDAHHDCWNGDPRDPNKVDCGNWLRRLTGTWGDKTKYLQVYPSWAEDIEKQGRVHVDLPLQVTKWNDWTGLEVPHRVRHVFLCRSAGWVPPHLDPVFVKFLSQLGTFMDMRRVTEYGDLMTRQYPTEEEYRTMYVHRVVERAAIMKITEEELVTQVRNLYGEDAVEWNSQS